MLRVPTVAEHGDPLRQTLAQKTAYELASGDWSSDVCSSDLTFTGAGVNNATQSIGDGEYELVLSGVSGLTASTFDFFRLLGDMDGNGNVDSNDFTFFLSSFVRATNDPLYLGAEDFDGNNTVDSNDFTIFVSNFLHSLPNTNLLH